MNADQQTGAHADRLLVASGKAVIVGRFQIPAEAMFSMRPEHEVSGDLARDGIAHIAVLPEMNPFGADTKHELRRLRECPRLLNKRSVSHSAALRV